MNNIENVSDLISITYRETFEDMEMEKHFHNSHEIICVLEGEVRFSINGSNYEVSKNTLILLSNFESHEVFATKLPYKRYFILINPAFFQSAVKDPILTSIFKHRPPHFKHSIKLEKSCFPDILNIIRAMESELAENQAFCSTILKAQLCMLFIRLYRSFPECFPVTVLNDSMNRILEVQKYMELHFAEDISLSDISKMYHTNMYYLSHLFKEVTGFSYKEYLILLRLARAKELLSTSSRSITAVADSSGFNNVNHFIRIFKKYEGITPYQYAKRAQP